MTGRLSGASLGVMRRLAPLFALLTALTACGGADRTVMPEGMDYADPAAWLCLPEGGGRAGGTDACARDDLAVDVVAADGTVTREAFVADPDAPADCFYVYPTTSRDEAFNADMVPGEEAEIRTTAGQFARFGVACRLYAPMYRQQSIAGLRDVFLGGDGGDQDTAYADVARAFRQFLEERNGGRPFVLYGHSQGTGMLKRLIAEEVADSPAADRLLGAYLLGLNVMVPTEGSDAEPELALPPCGAAGQTGCLVAFATYHEDHPPPADALFGRSAEAGLRPLCVNPAALLSQETMGMAPMGMVWPAEGFGDSIRAGDDWGAGVTARLVRAPGLVTGRCVADGSLGYLEIALTDGPRDVRPDDLGGEIMLLRRPQRRWGLHIADAAVAQDDLIEMVRQQSAAYAAGD